MSIPGNWEASFSEGIFLEGFSFLPNFLLRSYIKIGLTETEVMLLLHLLRFRQVEKDYFPSLEKIKPLMSLDFSLIKETIARLIERKFLAIETCFHPEQKVWTDAYTFGGLFQKLEDLWWEEEGKKLQKEREAPCLNLSLKDKVNLNKLHQTFERELGHPLSPMESVQISDWYQKDNYSVELILAALRQAVLRGALNLKYIHSVLRNWARHGIRTPEEAQAYEETFLNQREAKKFPPASRKRKKEKYEDVYLS